MLPGRSTKEIGREEGEEDDDGEEREVRSLIAQKVVACTKEKVCEHNGDKEAVQRSAGKVSCEAGFVRKSKMKKRRKAGEKETK